MGQGQGQGVGEGEGERGWGKGGGKGQGVECGGKGIRVVGQGEGARRLERGWARRGNRGGARGVESIYFYEDFNKTAIIALSSIVSMHVASHYQPKLLNLGG